MLLSSIAVAAGLLIVECPDSIRAVTVVADRGVVVSRTDTVGLADAVSIADALSALPGVSVSDCGGPAGLKTVSLRGMGSPYAAVYVDGIRVGNVQSGQTDLGMLDFGNSGGAVIDYARNSISLNTLKPVFSGRPVAGAVRFRGGAFGTYEPSGRIDFKLSERVSLSATAGGVLSRGDFPLEDGTARRNNDLSQIRAGVDSWGIMDGGDWHAKAYFNGSGRGTPGTVSWPSSDRQKDRNAFLQGVARKRFSSLYTLHASAKASFDDLEYLSGLGDNRYRQKEVQVNTSHRFSICEWLDASLAADVQWDGLESDLYSTSRTAVYSVVSAAFHPDRFKAGVALEYSGTFDRDGKVRNTFSPSMDFRWNVFDGFDLLAFARRAYRTPTFNELYYPGFGNPDLKAEDAWLTDVGAEYSFSPGDRWRVSAKADGFFNCLKDKIISAPTQLDPNVWMPYNVGVVQVAGVDARASVNYRSGAFESGFSARYSFQDAIDRTPDSVSCGRQIPFVSRHSVVLGAEASFRGWRAALDWNWRGDRYDSSGRIPDFSTLDLVAGKNLALPGSLVLALKLIARNLAGCRYELAGGYPMPGRAFYGEIDFKF